MVKDICDRLQIEPILMAKRKLVRGYDGKISPTPLTHYIHPHISLHGHKELSAPMFITDLGTHPAILGLPWMRRFSVWLDCGTSSLWFPTVHQPTPVQFRPVGSTPQPLPTPSASPTPTLEPKLAPRILPRLKPKDNDDTATIYMVGASGYNHLAKKAKQEGTQLFAMSMHEVNQELAVSQQIATEVLELTNIELSQANQEDLRSKLPPEYHDFLDVFDRAKANKLPPHRSSDHKIELLSEAKPPQSRAYKMSPYKLAKVKEYLNKNLAKGYITPSKAAYSSPVLCALKANGDLRFCVDYRKLNALTKRNRYPLPLIEEVIGKLRGCKHLTRLDIIAAFNKIRMDSESEELTTFTTGLGQYKYRVLPFGLINGPSTFQQYMNDVLWEHLDDFCQAYLDDILIYSRTGSEHRKHVRWVLEQLRNAGLQVDIKKCEFDVQETVFLGVIVSGQGLRMDPKKVEVILE